MARIVHSTITDEKRPVENVTQWCKKPACAIQVSEALSSFVLAENVLAPCLIDVNDFNASMHDAPIMQSTVHEVELLQKVCNEPYKSGWYTLQLFLDTNPTLIKLSNKQRIAMIKLSANSYTFPTTANCKDALQIWEDAEAFGWKPS